MLFQMAQLSVIIYIYAQQLWNAGLRLFGIVWSLVYMHTFFLRVFIWEKKNIFNHLLSLYKLDFSIVRSFWREALNQIFVIKAEIFAQLHNKLNILIILRNKKMRVFFFLQKIIFLNGKTFVFKSIFFVVYYNIIG